MAKPRLLIADLEVSDVKHLSSIVSQLRARPDRQQSRTDQRPVTRKLRLGINIDHVATVRNARGGAIPDPLRAAHLAVEAGADGITAHLREDRRHIRDDDMRRLKAELMVPLNFEMAATDEMVAIAIATRAPRVLHRAGEAQRTDDRRWARRDRRPRPSARGDRGTDQGRDPGLPLHRADGPGGAGSARSIGAPVVELHTGAWCEVLAHDETERAAHEFERIRLAAREAEAQGIECHAGHGLDYATARTLAAVPQIVELNIGHFLVGEAIFVGLFDAIRAMRVAMDEGRSAIGPGV